ncbi:MAG: hypothetical protein HOW73_32800 [Polyangiaceae bacterium]|nr:hypothetical protein [Polyangiaceae bacterium]
MSIQRACSFIAVALLVSASVACGDSDPDGPGGGAEGGSGIGGEAGQPGDGGAGGAVASMPSMAVVHAVSGEPAVRPLIFEPLAVHVTNAGPSEELTVVATMGTYRSEATFVASADGNIDTAADAPKDGTYAGADADGLVWSMLPDDSASSSFGDGSIHYALERDGDVLAEVDVERIDVADDVERRDVPAEAGFVGVVYVPEGPGPHPVVVGFGGSEGGLWFGDEIAKTYASLGYVGVGVAYFGAPTLPNGLTDVPLEYFESVFGYLSQIPEADPSSIAVMGASRGGELSLLLGAHYPEVKAVVALVPSGYVWGSTESFTEAAWTLAGAPLAYVPSSGSLAEVTEAPDGKDVYHFTPTFLDSIAEATPEEIAAATIPIEATVGPVLLIGGQADELWPSCSLAEVAFDRLETSGHTDSHADELVCYENSGHFTNPINAGFPMTTASLSYNASFGVYYAMGGTAEGLGHAARDSFNRVEAFLETSLR